MTQDFLLTANANLIYDNHNEIIASGHGSSFLDDTYGLPEPSIDCTVAEVVPSFLGSESLTSTNPLRDSEFFTSPQMDCQGLKSISPSRDCSHLHSGTDSAAAEAQHLEEVSNVPSRPSIMPFSTDYFSDFRDLIPAEFNPYQAFDDLTNGLATETQRHTDPSWEDMVYGAQQ